MYYVLVFIAALAASSTGAPNGGGSSRITGGSQAAGGQFPFVISLASDDSHICGGFIYNDRWVVTAANCVQGRDKSRLKVVVGALSLITPDPEEQRIEVFSLSIHPNYTLSNKLNDIALIELSRPIVFGPTAQTIRYDEIDELATPYDASIVGWGATTEEGTPATRLRYAPIDDLMADCREYGIDEYNQNYMICAGSTLGNVSPCQYDEGTPLVQVARYNGAQELIVVGVMSKNLGCNGSIPSIYTRLAAYYAWLLQTAGQQPAPGVRSVV